MASITDEEWGELTPESFETAALRRAVDAVDELRSDLNDGKDGSPPHLRTDLLELYPLADRVQPWRTQPRGRVVRLCRRMGGSGSRPDGLVGIGPGNAHPVDRVVPREPVLGTAEGAMHFR